MKIIRKILLISAIVIVCILGGLVIYFQSTATFPLKTTFPDYPETMMIYNVTGEINQQFGALDYGFTSDTLPTDEEAINIAENYLINNDLLPSDAIIITAELVEGFLSSDGNIVHKNIIDYSVTYGRNLSNYPVIGPGDTIWVVIAQNNEVVFYYKNWRVLEKADTVSIISPQDAYEKLKTGNVVDTPNILESFEIHAISLGYYALTADQENYYPVWIFYGPPESQMYYAVEAILING